MPFDPLPPLTVTPIGIVRSPFREKREAPRQGTATGAAEATIELRADLGHAVEDLEGFERIWVVFWFDRAHGWKPKVLPPRSDRKRGVLATRSPHRPNPIGLTAARLERVDGCTLHISQCDLLDGTPVLDVKPYVPYADAFPTARAGWLERAEPEHAGAETGAVADPIGDYSVVLSEEAGAMLAWLRAAGVDLTTPLESQLRLGPQPHPYRRIRAVGSALVIAVKDWRARFRTEGQTIVIERVYSGYRPRELATGTFPDADVHRAFASRFGAPP